ncbi:MAG: rhomboid family intramembrane serine protease [Bacteroidetes bacterium]|nr:rhomboid family intramembrane serine protease [Bacteroidota bacterium]MDA0936619.1 rhomboid family intramembrane serine protease [Bacteroidota bacterium]
MKHANMPSLPTVVVAIIIANALVSFIGFKNPTFFQRYQFQMAKIKSGDQLRLWTSGFLHVDLNHLFVNMLSLYFFAGPVVYNLGELKFLALYFTSLYLGNYLSYRYHNADENYTAVGASGAVSGVVYSAVLLYPEMKMMLLFLPIPLPAYVFATLYLIYTMYGMKKQRDNIGHTAHFGGAIAGLLATIAFVPSVLVNSASTLVILLGILVIAAVIFRRVK